MALLLVSVAPIARAAPLYTGFGGPAGFGTGILNRNDDGSTSAIDLTGAFSGGLRFYGGPYTEVFVNNNGNVTFNDSVYEYTPIAFPIADQPMIAPYWGDVDTRGLDGLASPDENLVYYHLEPGRMVVTWYNVGYYFEHNDLRMNFQLIITNATSCGSGDFDVEFRYDRCEWTTGDASGGSGGFGGTPAQAGFDAGNLMDFVALPGSFTPSILDLCTTTNADEPGVWVFSVRSGGVICREDMPCAVAGATGPCALGRTQCVGGVAMCQAITTPVDELCDAIDNDCNGAPDDAMDLCAPGLTCALGSCVPACFEGACDVGFECDVETGVCIESACIDVDCADDERCVAGTCVDACMGIVCPHGQICVSGACVDPCDAVVCEAGRLCREGRCVLECPCSPCPVGETCNADGSCTARGCDIITCPAGQYCEDSACHDACEGVVCPNGLTCNEGNCERVRPPDAGMPDAGVPDDAGPMDMDTGTTADAGVDAGRGPMTEPGNRGCGCRAAGAELPGAWAFSLATIALAIARRRR